MLIGSRILLNRRRGTALRFRLDQEGIAATVSMHVDIRYLA